MALLRTLINADGESVPAWEPRVGDTPLDQCKWPSGKVWDTVAPINQIVEQLNYLYDANTVPLFSAGVFTGTQAKAIIAHIDAVRSLHGKAAYSYRNKDLTKPFNAEDITDWRKAINFDKDTGFVLCFLVERSVGSVSSADVNPVISSLAIGLKRELPTAKTHEERFVRKYLRIDSKGNYQFLSEAVVARSYDTNDIWRKTLWRAFSYERPNGTLDCEFRLMDFGHSTLAPISQHILNIPGIRGQITVAKSMFGFFISTGVDQKFVSWPRATTSFTCTYHEAYDIYGIATCSEDGWEGNAPCGFDPIYIDGYAIFNYTGSLECFVPDWTVPACDTRCIVLCNDYPSPRKEECWDMLINNEFVYVAPRTCTTQLNAHQGAWYQFNEDLETGVSTLDNNIDSDSDIEFNKDQVQKMQYKVAAGSTVLDVTVNKDDKGVTTSCTCTCRGGVHHQNPPGLYPEETLTDQISKATFSISASGIISNVEIASDNLVTARAQDNNVIYSTYKNDNTKYEIVIKIERSTNVDPNYGVCFEDDGITEKITEIKLFNATGAIVTEIPVSSVLATIREEAGDACFIYRPCLLVKKTQV